MKINFIVAEAAPFAKVGGLGDVASSLPRALTRRGHDVSVWLPGYSSIAGLAEMETVGTIELGWAGRQETVAVRRTLLEETPFYFLQHEALLSRPKVYGYPDDAQRFAFFSRAALEAFQLVGLPDVVHVHDWHTSTVPLYLVSTLAQDPRYANLASILTIHNLAYQGYVDADFLATAGLAMSPQDPRVEFYGRVNLLRGGIVTSDLVTTVSETYAREIQTPPLGMGLEGILASRKKQLFGILNGIDVVDFDPAAFGFRAANPAGKKLAKAKLQERLGLPLNEEFAVLALISRLVEQKGLDLFPPILGQLLEQDVQLVILGTGEERFETLFREVMAKQPNKLSLQAKFDAELAKLIYAGADIFLMPSRFEPCGLGQMIAMRYGTIPVVRKTGGLSDTVFPYNPETEEGNGFLFSEYRAEDFHAAITNALNLFGDKKQWNQIVKNAMLGNYSWDRAVPHYEDLYRKASFLHAKRLGLVIAPEIRKDPILEEWAIIAKSRTKRPSDFKPLRDESVNNKAEHCPFCEGREKETPDELFSIRRPGTKPNQPGWFVRVTDNKYPALVKDEEPVHSHSWLYTSIAGQGAHEVIIETPDHSLDMADFPSEQMERVILAYRQRYRELSKIQSLRYILIFRNKGRSAGASLHHPHSQLIATPIVPRRIKEEMDSAHTLYEHAGDCVFCTMIQEELSQGKRVILDTPGFLVFSPYASRFPFEATIIPKNHNAAFSAIDDQEIKELSGVLPRALTLLKQVVNDPPYNLMIHSTPLGLPSLPYYHWHIEILPRLTTPAGFEWGTDFYINPTPPEEAARFLREKAQETS